MGSRSPRGPESGFATRYQVLLARWPRRNRVRGTDAVPRDTLSPPTVPPFLLDAFRIFIFIVLLYLRISSGWPVSCGFWVRNQSPFV